MIKYIQCLRRHPDLTPAEFRRHWEEYKQLCQELANSVASERTSFSITLAVDANDRIVIERGTAEPFDGMIEIWAHDARDLYERMDSPALHTLRRRLVAKQHECLDLGRCCFFFAADD